MEIHLDGVKREVTGGATLADLLPDLDPSCSVAVIRPALESFGETRSLRFSTTAGEVVIEISTDDPGAFPVAACGEETEGGGLALGWADRYSAAFGPFVAAITPARVPFRYAEGDVILGCGGYDPGRSYLIFARRDHMADHGAGAGGGIVGRVVSGRGVLARWSPGDRIICAERVMSREDTSLATVTTDRSVALEDGMHVISHVTVLAEGAGPASIDTSVAASVEHLLLALSDGRYRIERAASTHVRDSRMDKTPVPFEKKGARLEGTVTARTRGTCMGCVYISTRDTPAAPSHTVVGRVAHGIELVRFAAAGDVLCIGCEPARLEFLGRSLAEAQALAAERGIALAIDEEGGERIVVGQDPPTTLEVLAAGAATLTTVPFEEVIAISLDDEHAPATCGIFREITGLRRHSVGMLPLFFSFEDVYLFKPVIPTSTKINLENIPEAEVPPNMLAMTNDSRKGTGMVGVRKSANLEFGPTSEPFSGTNIIGTVLEPEKLDGIGEGKVVFIREVKP